MCECMSTQSLRNLCEHIDGRKVLLKYKITVKLDNWHTLFCKPKRQSDTPFSFGKHSATRITQAKSFNVTRCLIFNKIRLQTRCPCYTIFLYTFDLSTANYLFQMTKMYKILYICITTNKPFLHQFYSADYTNMLHMEAGVQNNKNILIK